MAEVRAPTCAPSGRPGVVHPRGTVGRVPPSGLIGFSRALYSNWVWHQPLQLLVDAGEGLTLALGTGVFSPEVVAITHGHSDHVLGLPGLAGARRFGKGAQDKPWTVIYPDGSAGVEAVRQAIAGLWRDVVFPLNWVAVRNGGRYPLTGKRTLEAFAVTHVPPEPALGYRVLEARRRLKADYAALPTTEVERLARTHGREHIMEEYAHVVFAHSGDAMPVEALLVERAELLVHDATFVRAEDRRVPIHAATEEVFGLARDAAVQTLVLNHLSIRYPRPAVYATLREQRVASGYTGPTWLLDEHEFIDLT